MTLIYFHAFFALVAVPLGLLIFINKKGTKKHKLLGITWIVFLVFVSVSAVFIQVINPGNFSAIHLLIPFTLTSLIYSIWNIRKYKKTRIQKYKYAHKYSALGVYMGALLVAGGLTLLPGRFFYELLF